MGIYQGKENREKGKGIAWLRINFFLKDLLRCALKDLLRCALKDLLRCAMISKVSPFPGISFSLFPYPFSLPYKFQFAWMNRVYYINECPPAQARRA